MAVNLAVPPREALLAVPGVDIGTASAAIARPGRRDVLVLRLTEGARVVTGTIVDGVTRLAVGVKAAGEVALLPLAEIGIPVLPEFAAPKSWSF